MICTERRAPVEAWAQAHPDLPFPMLIDESRDVARAYGVYKALGFADLHNALPSIFLVDGSGLIRHGRVLADDEDVPDPDTVVAWFDQGADARVRADGGSVDLPGPGRLARLVGPRRVRVEASVTLHAPEDEVWPLLHQRALWDPRVISLRLFDPGPVREGARYELRERTTRLLPAIRSVSEVVEVGPPARRVRGHHRMASWELTTRLEGRGGLTRCTVVAEVALYGPLRSVPAPAARLALQLYLQQNLERLAQHVLLQADAAA